MLGGLFLNTKNTFLSLNGKKENNASKVYFDKLQTKLNAGERIPEEEYKALVAYGQAESVAFEAEFMKEISECEALAKKLARGESLTSEEEAYLTEKNPEMLRKAKEAKKQGEALEKRLQGAKDEKERQEILTEATAQVASMLNKAGMMEEAVLRLEAIKGAEKRSREEGTSSETAIYQAMDGLEVGQGLFVDKSL